MGQQYKVVIVEDDEAIAQMYCFKFEADGFQVFIAENGEVGLKLIQEHMPDMVLLDLMLPLLSGDKMLESLRQQPWGVDIKVIVLSNISRNDAPPILNDLNVLRYIVKAQTTPSQLVTAVQDILGTK